MKKPRVFISYSHTDSKFVNELADKLQASGVDVWIDKWKIKVGDSITGKINEGIGESDFLLVVLSQRSVRSKWVQEEINAALIRNIEQDKRAFILPVLIEDCEMPTILQHRRYANFKDDPEKGLLELLDVIHPSERVSSSNISTPPHSSPAIVDAPDTLIITSTIHLELIRIPEGEFLMGSSDNDKEASLREKPQHKVNLHYDYLIGRFPVTNIQLSPFAEKHGIKQWGTAMTPAIRISWVEVQAYLRWLNKALVSQLPPLRVFRLPTEAEWEKAARGVDGRIYPWGNEFSPYKCNTKESGIHGRITPVDAYSPEGDSPFGCADMSGNVWEWTNSLNKPYPYLAEDGRETLGRVDDARVVRGGSSSHDFKDARCAHRDTKLGNSRHERTGFRIVIAPPLS